MSLTDIRLADIAGVLPGAIVLVEPNGGIVDADATGRRMFNAGDHAPHVNLKAVLAEPEEMVAGYLERCRRNREPVPGRFSILQSGKHPESYIVHGTLLRREGAELICLHFQDISSSSESKRVTALNETIEQLRSEIRARRHVEAILEAEKQTLASVFKGEPLIDALRILTTAVEKRSEGMLASILLLDEQNRLRHAVAPSLPESYIQAIDGVEIGPGVGSCGSAAHSRLTVIATDISTDPRWANFRDVAAAAGLRACWSSPILSSDEEVLGTLALYYKSPREPSDDELRLIANSAYVASVAIERYRSQAILTELLRREQQQRESAEAQNHAKDEFLAMLGHELRNPLSAIANAALALNANTEEDENSGEDESTWRLHNIIINEAHLLKRILDDLLDITRLSRGKLKLRLETFCLDAFGEELKTAVEATYPDRNIRFDLAGNLGFIVADRSRLRQSVQNLVDNAFKYSDPYDEVALAMKADEEAVYITVLDTGRGIDDALMQTIFEPFVQSDGSIARSNSGLGLGLAVAKRFALMHGGDISVKSDGPGRGSEFTLTMPRGNAGAAPPPVETSHEPSTAAAKTVLVVEDNDNAREGLCQLLQLWGHDVLTAANGKQALEIMRSTRPDVALVDIGLPVMNGYEFAQAVRGHADAASTKLVALTGYGQDSDRQRAIDAGFDSHVVKPADIKDLIEILGAPPVSP